MTNLHPPTVATLAEYFSKLVIQGQGHALVVISEPAEPGKVTPVEYVDHGKYEAEDSTVGTFHSAGEPEPGVLAVRIGV